MKLMYLGTQTQSQPNKIKARAATTKQPLHMAHTGFNYHCQLLTQLFEKNETY